MKQQLLEQVTNRLNKLQELQKQIENLEKQFKENQQSRRNFFLAWQSNCNHALYAVKHLNLCTWVTESYRCCLCSKRFDKSFFKEPPQCIGSYHVGFYASKTKTDRYPIPPERQAEVDEKRRELAKIDAEQASLEKKLRTLRKTVGSIEEELKDITHLLMSHFDYPQTVYEKPFHWGPDDFNYDPFD